MLDLFETRLSDVIVVENYDNILFHLYFDEEPIFLSDENITEKRWKSWQRTRKKFVVKTPYTQNTHF